MIAGGEGGEGLSHGNKGKLGSGGRILSIGRDGGGLVDSISGVGGDVGRLELGGRGENGISHGKSGIKGGGEESEVVVGGGGEE